MATSYLDLPSHDQEQERKSVAYIHRHRTWFLLLGFTLIALGAVATLHSLATDLCVDAVSGHRIAAGWRCAPDSRLKRAGVGGLASACTFWCTLHRDGNIDLPAPDRRRVCLNPAVFGVAPRHGLVPVAGIDLVPLASPRLARAQRCHQHRSRLAALERLAGVRSLVHWFLRGDRSDRGRRGLDQPLPFAPSAWRAGAQA